MATIKRDPAVLAAMRNSMLAGGVSVQRAPTSSYRSTLSLLLPEHATNYANRERKSLDLFHDRWPSVCNFFFPFVPQDPLLTSSLMALAESPVPVPTPTSTSVEMKPTSTSPTSSSSTSSTTTVEKKSTSPTSLTSSSASSTSLKLTSILQQALSNQATKADEDLMDVITRLPTFDVCLSATIKSKEYPSTHLIYAEFDKESQVKLQLAYDALAKKFSHLLTPTRTGSGGTNNASAGVTLSSATASPPRPESKSGDQDGNGWIPHVILAQADDKTSAINLVTRISEKWVPQKFTVETLTWLARDTSLDSKFVEYKTYPLGVAASSSSSLSSLSNLSSLSSSKNPVDDPADAVEEEEDYGDFDDDAAPTTMTSEWDDIDDGKPSAESADSIESVDPVDEDEDFGCSTGAASTSVPDSLDDGFGDDDDGGASPMREGDEDEGKEEKKSATPTSILSSPAAAKKSSKADKAKTEKMKNGLLKINQLYSLSLPWPTLTLALSELAIDEKTTVDDHDNDCWCLAMRVDRVTKQIIADESKLMTWSEFVIDATTTFVHDEKIGTTRVALPLYIDNEHYAVASRLMDSDEWISTMRPLTSEKEWTTWKSSLIWWRLLTELVQHFDGTNLLKMAIRETALVACRLTGLSKCHEFLHLFVNRYKSSTISTTLVTGTDTIDEFFDAAEVRGLPLIVAWLMDLNDGVGTSDSVNDKHLQEATYAVFFDNVLRTAKTIHKEQIRDDLIFLTHFSVPSHRHKSNDQALTRLVQEHLFDRRTPPQFFVRISSALKHLNDPGSSGKGSFSQGQSTGRFKLKKEELIKFIYNANSKTEVERASHHLMLAYAASRHELPPCPRDFSVHPSARFARVCSI